MKKNKTLKIIFFIIAILLITLISFVGIYKYDKGSMKNIMPDYELGKEFKGSRLITLKVNTSTKTDETTTGEKTSDENSEENSEENTEAKETQVNAPEILNVENYNKAKEIMEKRINDANFSEYDIRVSQEDGTIILDMPDSQKIDDVLQFIMSKGDFQIIDADTKDVLLSKDDLKESAIGYYSSTKGTTVYLNMKFKKEAVKTLEDITKTYVETKGEDGTTTKKTISMQIDGQNFLTTYFGETISTGEIQLPIGNASNDQATILENVNKASYLAMLLNNPTIEIEYTVDSNQYISPIVDQTTINYVIIAGICMVTLMAVYMGIKYRGHGILAIIAFIGYIAILLLLVRLTNVPLAIGSVLAVIMSSLIEIVFITKLLKSNDTKELNEVIFRTLLIQIPLYIIAIVLCFATLTPMVALGTTLFWGLIIATVYNYLVIKNLIDDKN